MHRFASIRPRLFAGALLAFAMTTSAQAGEGLLPDVQTVVPLHLQIQNKQQREILRFSNGIANTGAGPLRMRPEFPTEESGQAQLAIQEILDADGNLVSEKVVSEFEFHPEHNHWHIDGVALFEIRVGSPDGPVLGENSIKTTFCLIDWYKLEGNSRTPDRVYWDCEGDYQGISPGWVDQYHQATVGQSLELTGAPAGLYYLVSTANPDGLFMETDYANNTAWVSFWLKRDSNGNAKIEIINHSTCDTPGLCGEQVPNR